MVFFNLKHASVPTNDYLNNMTKRNMDGHISIVILEKNNTISAHFEGMVKQAGIHQWRTVDPDASIMHFESLKPDLAILGPSLDTEICLECVHKLKTIDPVMPILISCDEGCMLRGSESTPFEGLHYISNDPNSEEIIKAIEEALEFKKECESKADFPVHIGHSEEIRRIRRKIRRVADKDITVLITGESGTGKELIARTIHYHSKRCRGPLVKVNCGALPDQLLESEVFGFHKGAFTGAHKDKPGRLELADEGTLFVDEIGSLSLSLQVKFLQVLEEKSFARLGGTEDKVVDARVVAATNSDLSKKVREGTFRKDLFYRLNVIHIKAAPLRERKEDLPLLTHYFINKYCIECQKTPIEIPDRIVDRLMTYNWPGNVRELENVARRAIVLRDWDLIMDELQKESEIPTIGQDGESEKTSPKDALDDDMSDLFKIEDFSLKKITKAYIADIERKEIQRALETTHWNRRKAAQMLHVSYKTLLSRIVEYGLKPQ
jgi:two-component system response regulator AtoC